MAEQEQNGVGGSGKPNEGGVPVVRLLDDKPTNEDKTGDGHQRVADAMAKLIEGEDGGKAIALEGSWGSGKSSVVRMLEGACCKDTLVYTFDAWKHEGDPLRVAFLRGLVDCLWKPSTKPKQRGWLKDGEYKAWRRGIDDLSAGAATTRTLDSVNVETSDIVALTAVLAIPTAIAFAVAYLTTTDPGGQLTLLGEIAIYFLLGLLLVPVFVKWFKPDAIARIFEVMVTRQPKKQTVQLHENGEVSSLDFEREFNKLLKDVLSRDGSRRLVIVIDNLDRLSTEDALAVWTSMRVFLEMDAKAAPWLTRFWLIVPYDRTALAQVWNSRPSSQAYNPTVPTNPVSTRVHHNRPSSFLEKTFAVRFDVPPLLLANWEKALGEYLNEALGAAVTESTSNEIARLSRRFASEQHHPPTPRHLKLFVNDIGALVRQHGTAFPLETLAAYAILRRTPLSPDGIREDLRTERQSIDMYLDEGWLDEERATDLACLVFNTHDAELARELLLVEPIGRAIGAGDHKALERLLANPAAESVLEESLLEVLDAIGRDNANNVEHGFNVLDAMSKNAHGRITTALKTIALRLYPDNNVLRRAKNAPDLCRRVARLATDPITLARVVQHLTAIAQDEPSEVSSEDLAKCWSALWGEGGKVVRSDPGFRQIVLPTDAGRATHFLLAIRHAPGADLHLWQRLHRPEGLDLTKAIIPPEPDGAWDEEHLDVLRVVSFMHRSALDWKSVADAMHESISGADEDAGEITAELLRFMRGFDPGERVPNAMWAAYANNQDSAFVQHRAALRDGGCYLGFFATAIEAERWADAADFLVEYGLSNAIAASTPEEILLLKLRKVGSAFFVDPQSRPEVLDAIAAIDTHWLKPFLQQQLNENESAPIAAAVISRMEPDAIRACFHPAWVIKQWATLNSAEETAPGLIASIVTAHEVATGQEPYALSRRMVAKGEINKHPELKRFLVEHNLGEPESFDSLEDFMSEVASDFWAKDIARNGLWYALLLALHDSRHITLGTNFYIGLEGLATALVEDADKVREINNTEAHKLLDIVGKTHELTLAKALRDLAATTVKDKRLRLYEVFGDPIREAMLASPQPSDVPSIVTLAVNGSHGVEPAWVPGFLADELAPGVVATAEEAHRVSLLATVGEKAEQEGKGGGPYTVFLERCRKAGLLPPEKTEEPEDQTSA